MSDTKWTKGPWGWFDTQYQSSVEEWPHYSIGGTEFETHAVVRPGCEEALEKGDMLANARLIAAAPELYEALEHVAKTFAEEGEDQIVMARAIIHATKVLAKARGETP